MPRAFNVEVFNKTIGGGESPPVYRTGEEFYGLLGSADSLIAQVFVDSVATVPTTVTVTYEMSNATEEETWTVAEVEGETLNVPIQVEVEVTSEAPAPQNEALGFTVMPQFIPAAYGRMKVAADEPGATVRIVACGRSRG